MNLILSTLDNQFAPCIYLEDELYRITLTYYGDSVPHDRHKFHIYAEPKDVRYKHKAPLLEGTYSFTHMVFPQSHIAEFDYDEIRKHFKHLLTTRDQVINYLNENFGGASCSQ